MSLFSFKLTFLAQSIVHSLQLPAFLFFTCVKIEFDIPTIISNK